MLNKILKFFLISVFLPTMTAFSQNTNINDTVKWGSYFSEVSLDGTFVLLNVNSGKYSSYNINRAGKRYLPASTFKIMNTLIGLENNTVSDIDEIFRWDSIVRPYDAWNKDLSLREAFRISAVWVYQELARRTGRNTIEHWIRKCNYGNMKTGPEIDRFWLDGELTISAIEQVDFIRLLYQEKLPFRKTVQQEVKDIMLTDSVHGKRLYAKTGWTARIEPEVGWYVGFVEDGFNTWIFALNLDIKTPEDIRHRIEISRKILDSEGIFPITE